MPASIEDYFKSLLDLITSQPFVENPQVRFEKRAETVGFIRGDVGFKDGSSLHFREPVNLRLPLKLVMYAYPYQKPDGSMVFRYDNTAHHMNVKTSPHHKHTDQGKIIASDKVGIKEALREIEILLAAGDEAVE